MARPLASVANFRSLRESPVPGHSYAASSANCWKVDFPGVSNWPLWIICATSMPAKVADADGKDLKPFIGRVSFLMNRWSCSMVLFRNLTWRMSTNQNQPRDEQPGQVLKSSEVRAALADHDLVGPAMVPDCTREEVRGRRLVAMFRQHEIKGFPISCPPCGTNRSMCLLP